MNRALVSCIVPTLNSERYLEEALNSIFAQTYQPLEVIVVDGGSSDGTARVIGSYGGRVRCLIQDQAGPTAARNLGLSAARGELIAFLDSDNVWHPEKLAQQMARFQARPELDVCITQVQVFWVRELSVEAERYRSHPRAGAVPGYSTNTLWLVGQYLTRSAASIQSSGSPIPRTGLCGR